MIIKDLHVHGVIDSDELMPIRKAPITPPCPLCDNELPFDGRYHILCWECVKDLREIIKENRAKKKESLFI